MWCTNQTSYLITAWSCCRRESVALDSLFFLSPSHSWGWSTSLATLSMFTLFVVTFSLMRLVKYWNLTHQNKITMISIINFFPGALINRNIIHHFDPFSSSQLGHWSRSSTFTHPIPHQLDWYWDRGSHLRADRFCDWGEFCLVTLWCWITGNFVTNLHRWVAFNGLGAPSNSCHIHAKYNRININCIKRAWSKFEYLSKIH